DAASEAVVVESLRRLGVAALVVTHRPAVRELADRVVRLDKGRVATGDSAGLDGASARLAGASAATVAGGDASPASRTDGVTAEAATADAVSARDSAVAAAVVGEGVVSEGDGRAESRPVVDGAPGALPEPSAGALTGGAADEPGEAPPSSGARHKSLLGRLFDAEAGSRARLALALALAWAATFAAVALMGVSSWLLAFAATLPSPLFLEAPAVMVRFFAISRGVFRYTERLASHDVALRLQSALRLETYKSLARTTLLGTRRGDLLTRVIADVEAIQDLVVRVWIPFGSSSLVIVVSCLLVGLVSPGAAAVLFGTAVLAGVVVPWLARKASERADAAAIPTRGELADRVHELARTAPDLVAYGADAAFVAEYQRVDKLLRADEERSTWVRGLAEGFQTVAAGLAVVGALWIGATQIGPDGFWTAVPLGFTSIFADPGVTSGWRGIDAVGFAFLAVLALTPLALHESLSTLAQSAQHATRAQVALRRVTQVLKAPKVGSGDIPDVLETAARPRLTVANLSAGWPGGDAVVEGLTLDVGPGRRVALTGPSGVGKTTVAATVLGLIPALGGELAVTGRPGYLAQDAHIFNTSVAENVRIGRRDATADDVAKALARAGLAGLDLDRVVGEEGSALSGGEARRVALARLLVGDYQVLVLDEPTEHLDAVTAAALMDDIWSTAADLPILVITHDADVMARCDEVIRLGRLAW
ncbi:MAG: thiol reductant ABC exporter subunit CydC, partial [Propionibacteriaceae bacterium]|nr:thiol reductant ABC exporter subunit CydC [Propionibacteriaceae bacterium]